MRISSLYVTHFLGIERADFRLRAPILLACGANAAGKSSLRDAVALALTADLGRVSLKKDAPALIREGADLAVCEVKNADGDEWRVTINRSGKVADSQKGRDNDPVLPYVLDAQRFARLAPTERRSFLFGLMGVKMAPADIAARLEARGCDAAKAQRLLPLLRSGFAAAEDEAKRKTTEARGAWKAVTGEAYGSEKAKTWRATVPPYDAAAAAKLHTELLHADVAIGQWQESIGRLQAEEQRRQGLRAKLPARQEHGAKVPRIEAKLQADLQGLADAEQALKVAQQKAGTAPRVGLLHDLAHALRDTLFFVANTHQFKERWTAPLLAYEAEHGQPGEQAAGDPEARAQLPDLQAQLKLMQSAVANDKRDLAAAQAAHDEAKRIATELDEVFDAAALVDAREQVDRIKAGRVATAAEADKLKSIKALAEAAETKTKQAGQHAADVSAWDALAQALSPDGIPAEILSEALGPVNDRLAQDAADTGWPVVAIDRDMAITYGAGRPYALCSESERWRADAMLAETIGQVSGSKLLVLDRMDVLDLPGRSELIGWLQTLAECGEVDTALLFATLKQAPQGLGESTQVEWIEAGVVGHHERMKEAA